MEEQMKTVHMLSFGRWPLGADAGSAVSDAAAGASETSGVWDLGRALSNLSFTQSKPY